MDTDVMIVIGANPTEAHPVFASQMKRRLREGAKLIVVDPRQIGLVRSAHIKAEHHIPLAPGTNVPVVNALRMSSSARDLSTKTMCGHVATWSPSKPGKQ